MRALSIEDVKTRTDIALEDDDVVEELPDFLTPPYIQREKKFGFEETVIRKVDPLSAVTVVWHS